MDAATGELLWAVRLGGPIRRRPAVAAGRVVAIDESGRVHALDVDDGRIAWTRRGPAVSAPVSTLASVHGGAREGAGGRESEGGSPSPKILWAEAGARIVAVDAASGKVLWQRDLGSATPAESSSESSRQDEISAEAELGQPAAAFGQVFVPRLDGVLFALDAADGTVRFGRAIGPGLTTPRPAERTVLVVGGGFLVALGAADGREQWRTWIGELVGSPPAVTDGRVLVAGGNGEIAAFDLERGEQRWRRRGDGYVRSEPVASDGLFFLGVGDHRLAGLDAVDGEIRWQFETDTWITRALSVERGRAIFGGVDGRVYSVPVERASTEGGASAARAARPPPRVRVGAAFFDGMPELAWTFEMADAPARSPFFAPAVPWGAAASEGGRVFLGVGDGLVALDARSGEVAWQRRGAAAVEHAVAIEGPFSVEGSSSGAEAGSMAQPASTRAARSPGPGGGPRLFYGDRQGFLRAVRARDGKELWKLRAAGPISGRPVLAAGQVFFGSEDGGLYAVDRETGAAVWRVSTSGAVGRPVVDRDLVLASSGGGELLAVDRQRGRELWRLELGPSLASVWAGEGSIFAVDARGEMLSVEPVVGGERWRSSVGVGVRRALGSAHGLVYAATEDGQLVAVSHTSGLVSWRTPIGARAASAPVLDDGLAYVGSHDHRLHAINAVNGEPLWWLETGGPVWSVAAADGRVYAGGGDGRLVAVDLP